MARISFATEDTAKEIDGACRDHGFVVLSQVPGFTEDAIAEAFEGAKELFALKDKSGLKRIDPESNRGYTPYRSEKLYAGKEADYLEAFSVRWTRNDYAGCPERFVKGAEKMIQLASTAISDYAVACAKALGLPNDYFSKHFVKKDLCTVRFLHYPPLENPAIRAGEHIDFGLFTFVFVNECAPGLQIHTSEWHDLPRLRHGDCVVNTGALAARWTNDNWRATLHRVVATQEDFTRDRYSIAIFADPDADAIVSVHPSFISTDHPCKYPPISSYDYVLSKLSSMMQRRPHDLRIDLPTEVGEHEDPSS